jgi:hypothetical protein
LTGHEYRVAVPEGTIRSVRVFLAAVIVVATASVASGAGADRTVTSPGLVRALARSGFSVAFLSGPYPDTAVRTSSSGA